MRRQRIVLIALIVLFVSLFVWTMAVIVVEAARADVPIERPASP